MGDSTDKIDMTGDEALSFLEQIKKKNQEILMARLEATDRSNEAKEAKAKVQMLQDQLSDLIRSATEDMKDRPLFNQEEPKADEPKTVAVNGAWRNEPITVLVAYGATNKDVDKLIEADITTMGLMADCSNLTAIKGIGPAVAERLAKASAAFHEANGQAESEDDEDGPNLETIADEIDDLDGKPRPYAVKFTRAKPKRHIVYACNDEQALAYAMDQLTFVESVSPIPDNEVMDEDVIAHAPEGYGDGTGDPDEILTDDEIEEAGYSVDPEDDSQEFDED